MSSSGDLSTMPGQHGVMALGKSFSFVPRTIVGINVDRPAGGDVDAWETVAVDGEACNLFIAQMAQCPTDAIVVGSGTAANAGRGPFS